MNKFQVLMQRIWLNREPIWYLIKSVILLIAKISFFTISLVLVPYIMFTKEFGSTKNSRRQY